MAELHLHLSPHQRKALDEGRRTMPAAVRAVVEAAGWNVTPVTEDGTAFAARPDLYHLVINQPVTTPRTLTLRVSGWEPFWRIEPTNDRWDWEIARRPYDPALVLAGRGKSFLKFWRGKLFPDIAATSGGGVFVPLQGKLLQHRHFQAAAPIEMLKAVLTRWPGRPVTATLHPREFYTSAERGALEALGRAHPNFTLAEGGSTPVLAAADLVVTQNSTMALKGFLLEKPAMLWAAMDFHHIAASVPRQGRESAFQTVEAGQRPDYGRYLFWYLKKNALLAWDENLPTQIRRRLLALGWPL